MTFRRIGFFSLVKEKAMAGPRQKFQTGFTLIELLVVIAIIAVLVAILLPALARVREQSKTGVCAANQRQIGIVLSMYTSTFNDTLPNCDDIGYWYNWSYKLIFAGLIKEEGPARQGNWIYSTGSTNRGVFQGVRTVRPGQVLTILHCPSLTPGDLAGACSETYANAYGTPQGVMGSLSGGGGPLFSRLSMFPRLENTVAAYDGTNLGGGSSFWDTIVGPIWGAVWNPSTKDTMGFFLSKRHSGNANCLFLDGHVKGMHLIEITQEMFPPREILLQLQNLF